MKEEYVWKFQRNNTQKFYLLLEALDSDLTIKTGLKIKDVVLQTEETEDLVIIRMSFKDPNVSQIRFQIGYERKEIEESLFIELLNGFYSWLKDHISVICDKWIEEGNPEGRRIMEELSSRGFLE